MNKEKTKTTIETRPLRSHKAILYILILDWLVFVVSFSLYHVFRPDILAIAVYLSFYLYLWLTGRPRDSIYLLLSSALASLWMLFAGKEYGYGRGMWLVGSYEVFPFFAWAGGLAGLHILFSDIEKFYGRVFPALPRFLTFSGLYLVLIIALETISYHVFMLRNVATSAYPGLPVCDCIHAPVWMQAAYLLMGPLYYLVCLGYERMTVDFFAGRPSTSK